MLSFIVKAVTLTLMTHFLKYWIYCHHRNLGSMKYLGVN